MYARMYGEGDCAISHPFLVGLGPTPTTELTRYLQDQLEGSTTALQYELKLAEALEFVRRPVPAP